MFDELALADVEQQWEKDIEKLETITEEEKEHLLPVTVEIP